MSETVLNLLQRVTRKLGLSANLSEISEADESQWLLDRLNERYVELRRQLPLNDVFFQESITLGLTPTQRLYAIDGNRFADIYLWSVQNDSNRQAITHIKLEDLLKLDPNYKTTQGDIRYFYIESGLIGFYPNTTSNQNMTFFQKKLPERLESASEIIEIPATWLPYLELAVELDYQLWKGMGLPEVTLARLNQHYIQIYSELNRLSDSQFKSE